jgi:hypothetical protein
LTTTKKFRSFSTTSGEALQRDMLPKMRCAAFVLGIIEPDIDPLLLMQVGAAGAARKTAHPARQ